jgi:hypothetical protein
MNTHPPARHVPRLIQHAMSNCVRLTSPFASTVMLHARLVFAIFI